MSIKEFYANFVAHHQSEFNSTPDGTACVKALISAAQMFALSCIDIEDVCYCLSCEEADIPAEFYTYADLYGAKYDIYQKLQKLEEDINKQLK